MKLPITSRLTSIALTACMSLGLVASEAIAGVRAEFNQFNFGPLTTRALFPGKNVDGPGVQQTDWYPVYLWRLPSDQCSFYLDPPGISIPFTDDHLLVPNVAPSDPTGVLHNWGCPLAFEGFGIFEDESALVPRLSNLTGNVPVYFVHKDDVAKYSAVPFNMMTWGDFIKAVRINHSPNTYIFSSPIIFRPSIFGTLSPASVGKPLEWPVF